MARFFRSPSDLAAWVKSLGAQKAATAIANIPKAGKANLTDIAETTKRIAEASDANAAETLFDLLKSAGVANDDVEKAEVAADHIQVANDLLKRKVISQDEHAQMVKQAQIMRQPGQYDMPLRLCPKLPMSVGKKLISTYNCRHYCLDGIVLDDDPMRVYCGELLWRQHVAQKFSHEWQDRKTGEWVGGYINDRFYKFPDAGTPSNPNVPRDGGNPMSLKPGERTRIPRPHQWSTERRMQEARDKNSTKDNKLGKTASGWLGRAVTAQSTDQTFESFQPGQIDEQFNPAEAQTDSQGTQSGGYVSFSFDNVGNLVMTPTPQGIEEAKEYIAKGDTSDNAFLAMIEDHLANGWELINPEEIGALTSALILSNDASRDDHGKLLNCNAVWSNIDFYQVRSELQGFAEGTSVTWRKANDEPTTASTDARIVEADKSKSLAACPVTRVETVTTQSSDEVAHEVLAAAGGLTKIASEVLASTVGDPIEKAFSMAIDLHSKGLSAEDAVLKVADATGLDVGKATVIREMALKKMAAHTGDAYVTDKKAQPKGPQVKPDAEVQQDAAELALTQE